MIPTCFVIVLKGYPERQEHARQQFEREGVTPTWVYAIEGAKHGVKPLYPMHYEQGPDKPYFITEGMCALILTNYMVVQMADIMGLEEWFVFEDDIILPENFKERYEDIRSQIPDKCKAVWFESCCTDNKDAHQYTKDLYKVKWPLCSAGIWYRRSAIPAVMNAAFPANTPWDIALEQRAANDLCAMTVLPKLCKQATFEGQMPTTIHPVPHITPPRG
jgi:GR25 family glycosyltransferase involved in LPS biosynthesis